ncbi:MAG: DUF4445 domain-containing protein [Opitutales bacterium]|nr:DUF4445 domain-containing protein [Opitutales bacterium]
MNDSGSIPVRVPGKGERTLLRSGEEPPPTSLADFLEEHQCPLNTRCGGRGLCQGCRVELTRGDGGKENLRACQTRLADLPKDLRRVDIPEASWRDHSLHGVSVFEIRTSLPAPDPRAAGHGIALDVGTTTVAAALWDLATGHCLGHASIANAQSRYGDNVLARIQHAVEKSGGIRDLQSRLVAKSLVPLIRDLCGRAGIEPSNLRMGTASGNTVMLHTLAGEPLDGLSVYPFRPVFLVERIFEAGALSSKLPFPLRLLPGLGPFVGADIAVGALASGILEAEAPVLLIDFGTNGEILLKSGDGYLATATAAGPAFEGGRLTCGATARKGVIASLRRDRGTWAWSLVGKVEPTTAPVGISGAAYIDFLALGHAEGLLNDFGRFATGHPEVAERLDADGDRERFIRLGPNLVITEGDVAELLQAKAAIGGGVATLLDEAGLRPGDLRGVYVAGGFGYHLHPGHACHIGLLPDVLLEKIETVGNASLAGASFCLLHPFPQALAPLVQAVRVIELNQVPSFEDHFTDALRLVPE